MPNFGFSKDPDSVPEPSVTGQGGGYTIGLETLVNAKCSRQEADIMG